MRWNIKIYDPDWLNQNVKIVERKEGIVWDHIKAAVNDNNSHKTVIYRFGPLDAIFTYIFFGTKYEWYGIKRKALRNIN